MTTRSRPRRIDLETLEARHAPAQVLSPTQLTYQDKDGDMVLVSFTKPLLKAGDPNAIFKFDSGAGAVNGTTTTAEQLQRIDLIAEPIAAIGVGVSVTVTQQGPAGNGLAAVGEIDATGIDLGAVTVHGDLGRILAGDGTFTTPGIRSLSVQSLGRDGTATGAPDLNSAVAGDLRSLRVGGDVTGAAIAVTSGGIGTMTINGSVIGGYVAANHDLGRGTVTGNVVGSSAGFAGIFFGGTIHSLLVGGNVQGGSQTGSADLVQSGTIFANHIKQLTIGGSLLAGTDATTGTYWGNGAVGAYFDIGSLTIRGDMVGNTSSPAVISAGGHFMDNRGPDLAIGSVRVKGRVEHGLILAGVDPVTWYAYQPVDADAQIGSVTIGGDWIASSIAAGVVAGVAGFGSADDTKMSGQGVRDDPTVSSEIRSITIGGQIEGTANSGDHFGFVAEEVGRLKVAGTNIALAPGNGNDDISLATTGDVSVRELP
jgi:hypothetical protein